MRKRNVKKYKWLLLLLLLIGIGYAAISTVLKLNGTIGVNKANWNIRWENVSNQGGVDPISEPEIEDDGNNEDAMVSFSVQLNNFGDYYEFTIDAVNLGAVNAKLSAINLYCDNTLVPSVVDESHPSPLPPYASLTVTNEDGSEVTMGEILNRIDTSTTPATPGRKTFKIRIEYTDANMSSSDLNMSDDETHTFGVGISYDLTRDEEGASSHSTKKLALGDYFTLVPDDASYTVLGADTGYSEDLVYNPRELTLWRVVGRNNNGTYDAVSEYYSSIDIAFDGVTGYKNFVGVLQEAASHYEKEGYTVGSRAFGYDGQTLRITDDDGIAGEVELDDHWGTPELKTGTGQEYDGGVKGDNLYLKDTQMVSQFYRTYYDYGLMSEPVNDAVSSKCYWVASRYYWRYPINPGYSIGGSHFNIRYIYQSYNNDSENSTMGSYIMYAPNASMDPADYAGCGIRPIITLKSDVVIADGTGNISDPYVFE